MSELEKAFHAGTHWKEKYFKEDVNLGKIPDFQQYVFLSLCEAASNEKLPLKPVLENHAVLFTEDQLHKIAVEHGFYELVAIQNVIIRDTVENATFVTAQQLANITLNLQLLNTIIKLYKAKLVP